MYTRVTNDETTAGIFIGEINRKPEDQGLTRLVAASHAGYMRGGKSAGHLLYLRHGTLVSHAFDAERLALVGDAFPVADKVGNFGAMGLFALGGDVVVYRHGPTQSGAPWSQLTWVDRQGKPISVVGSPAAYANSNALSLSPDDSRAAAAQIGPADVGLGNYDVWVVDLTRGVPQRLTSDAARQAAPIRSPAGDSIAYQSGSRGVPGNLFTMPSDGAGSGQLLFRSDVAKTPTSWSRDKRFILFQTNGGPTAADVWLLPLEGARQPIPLIQTKFQEPGRAFSPRCGVDRGRLEPVRRIRGLRSSIQCRRARCPGRRESGVEEWGGIAPRWRRDGELFYSQAGRVDHVRRKIPAQGPNRAGPPTPLFRANGQWDVASDGKRFLVAMPLAEVGLSPITVVLHWNAGGQSVEQGRSSSV